MMVIPPLTGHELLLVVFQFPLLLLVARALGGFLAHHFQMPSVVGELLAGFVLGHSLFATSSLALSTTELAPAQAGDPAKARRRRWLAPRLFGDCGTRGRRLSGFPSSQG